MAGEGHSFGSLVEEVNTKARTDSTVPNRTLPASGVDLNTLTTLGFCDGNSFINAPAEVGGEWCYIFTQSYSAASTYRQQVCTAFQQNGKSGTWTRQMIAGVWSAWVPDKTGDIAEIMRQLALKANKATTLAGYGITDAYDKTAIDAALALKAPKKQPTFEGLVTTSPAVPGAWHAYEATPAIRLQTGAQPVGTFAPIVEQSSIVPGTGYTTFLRFGMTRDVSPAYAGTMATISLSGESNLALALWHFKADGGFYSSKVVADKFSISDPSAARGDASRDFDGVSTQLRWTKYGSGHVISDVSSGLSPAGSVVGQTDPAALWTPGYPVLMGWNGQTTYGVRVDACRVADRLGDKAAGEYATVAGLNTKADKATTLAGYAITDAYTAGQANDLFAARTNPTIAGTQMTFTGGKIRAIDNRGISLDATTYGFLTGLQDQHMCANRLWDGATWHAIEAGATSSSWVVARGSANLTFFKEETPITAFNFDTSGTLTCARTIADIVKVADMAANIADRARDFNGVSGLLRWNKYGNGHLIFDASAGVSPNGITVNAVNSAGVWEPSYPALMGWNGSATFGVRVDSARNSDQLGGVAAGSYQLIATTDISSGDLNTVMSSGKYKGTNVANAPDAGWWYFDATVHAGGSWQVQTAVPFGGSANPTHPANKVVQKLVRRQIEGTWTAWQEEGTVMDVSGQDLNEYTGTGTYIGQTLSNGPPLMGYCYIQVVGHSSGLWCMQTATPYGKGTTMYGPLSPVQYIRRLAGGVWEAWEELGGCPVGTLLSWPGKEAPTGFIGAYGQQIDSNVYPRLYTIYGARLPDLRSYFVSYADKGRGLIFGQDVLQAQPGRVGAHTHSTPGQIGGFFEYSGGGGSPGVGVPLQSKGTTGPVQQAGDFISELNYPNNVAFLPIIRAG